MNTQIKRNWNLENLKKLEKEYQYLGEKDPYIEICVNMENGNYEIWDKTDKYEKDPIETGWL